MTVQELIDKLQTIENKKEPVRLFETQDDTRVALSGFDHKNGEVLLTFCFEAIED